MDLALHGGRGPFVLEKWYLDVLLPDGAVLMVYLGWMRVLGVPLARVTAELFTPRGPVVGSSATATGVTGGPERLSFGPVTLAGDVVAWRMEGLSGELRFAPRHPPAVLRDPFVARGSQRLLWTVEVPDADVTGEIVWPGGGRAVAGRGYRDRVWFDLAPWRFPIRELRWGRAVSAAHAVTWVSARTEGGEMAGCWRDGEVVANGAAPPLGPSRVLVETKVADIPGLRLGLLRPLLRRLTGDPFEIKRAGPATLAGEAGLAIHEEVRWS